MKRIVALVLMLALCLSLAACGSSETKPEEKKELPVQTEAPQEEVPAETHYRDIMIPFEEIVPAERIVILQNTLNYGREGFYTEETKPVTEDIAMDGETVAAYSLTYPLNFLTFGYENGAQVVNVSGEVLEFTKEELEGSYIIIKDFQSWEAPVLYNPATGTKVVDFDHIITDNKEMVISIVTEQDRRFADMFALVQWDMESTNYHVMATDKFFIPVTPEDYDDGELRGALSGSVNGTFPDMIIAQGKINDVIYLEKVVN